MKKTSVVILFLFLLGITFFSVYKYASSLKEKYDLQSQLEGMRREVTTLENVKNNLTTSLERERTNSSALQADNAKLKDDIQDNETQLAKLDSQIKDTLRTIEALNSQVASLQAENVKLMSHKEKLTLELAQVTGEKDALQSKLSSIPELKRMIKEIKKNMHKTARVIERRRPKEESDASIEGNQGYLLKNGKSTFPPKIRIEVAPIS